jgi:hypothetical protein
MSQTKSLRGECQHCGEPLQFAAEAVGLTADCPHCGQPTDLLLAVPRTEPTVPMKTIIFTVIAILILVGGLIAAMVAVKRLQREAEQRRGAVATADGKRAQVADPFARLGFQVSAVTLEKTPGSSLVHAVGTIRNQTARRLFGLKVELEVLDSGGGKIGTATDYQPALEPQAAWNFKALVLDAKAAGARIVAITESP